ncbi:cobaltochelatase subunit CobN [uncultured Salinisphaera sp.]|uniref:cobaltochelatase subunit CobN n=1 Tax=uncultured Salinisphaera sp. TaxID=359372 RepID=UPI0032B0F67A|tara:strand:- start:481 stop:4275 length:3795 start_codon:yes stop_codon:yes gene_type:complete
MHLLAAQPGGFTDDEGIIDLDQSPGDIVIMAAADGILGLLAETADAAPPDWPSIRLANWRNLAKPAALDLYRNKTLDHARVVILALTGGRAYWPYGVEQLIEWAGESSERQLVIVPGEDVADEDLFSASTVSRETAERIWRYLREGGADNARALLAFVADRCLGCDVHWQPPATIPRTVIYHPERADADLADWRERWPVGPHRPVALVVLYRSHLQNGNMAVFDDLLATLTERGLNPLPVAVASLKEQACICAINGLIEASRARVVLNTTGFALRAATNAAAASDPGTGRAMFEQDIPVLQLILASTTETAWQTQDAGLRARDLAMYVVLPELDGRIVTRAVGFKTQVWRSPAGQIDVVRHALMPERAAAVADLALAWARLQTTANADKRIALVLANNPGTDGRIGNGVGLDTPAATHNLLVALTQAGYVTGELPADPKTLMERMLAALSNDARFNDAKPTHQSISLEAYQSWFNGLPAAAREAVHERWGPPTADPKFQAGRLQVAGLRFGNVFVGPQPARGFDIDLAANYHDPDLVPPHGYLAFYAWLRQEFAIDALVNVGKHGNLEWLPGKSVALSATCWPDIVLGPMPQLYPFIVNDPGEGAQAKRRSQAVIIDHMTPPIVRAETYGDLAMLEGLVDEYFEALGLDTRREAYLRDEILALARSSHVAEEIAGADGDDQTILDALDTYICDLKEAQIRGGLHRFGVMPEPEVLAETLVSLVRTPRGDHPADQSILRALAADLALGDYDPLDNTGTEWTGPRPACLANLSDAGWRTDQHTRTRLELLALQLVRAHVVNDTPPDHSAWPATAALLDSLRQRVLPALAGGIADELSHTLAGLAGRFVPPGPSGAPTRGRLDTLPTGRNFYAVDSRAIPTRTAWTLGQRSAEAVIERHLQDHGDYPRSLGLSVWGTATMRTGGDDIAQAFALMGIRPVWAGGSNRVVDFEILPAFQLGRPRVDVTLRVSGFFRDAFANLIRLFDAAVTALAELDEPGNTNTVRQNVERDSRALIETGESAENGWQQARHRVFGAKPGAYGAGLSEVIEQGAWRNANDLANAYIQRGGYAYGQAAYGEQAHASFTQRLGRLDGVIQNQDNREHDILDSADYFQFQGGMANAAGAAKGGQRPAIYHGDHSDPSSPRVRTLDEEINRVMRSRVTNPKWISAMQGHGYKGAFEMAATMDYLFAYDATTDTVADYQYENVADAFVHDTANRAFLEQHNPDALQDMSERLMEAIQRGLWAEPGTHRQRLEDVLLDIDAAREG